MTIGAELQEKPPDPAEEARLTREKIASPVTAEQPAANPLEGLKLAPLHRESVEGELQGLRVLEVAPNSPASRAGLKAGDIISQVGNIALRDAADLDHLIGKRAQRPVLLRVRRGAANIFLAAS